jgi:hypothetical protein
VSTTRTPLAWPQRDCQYGPIEDIRCTKSPSWLVLATLEPFTITPPALERALPARKQQHRQYREDRVSIVNIAFTKTRTSTSNGINQRESSDAQALATIKQTHPELHEQVKRCESVGPIERPDRLRPADLWPTGTR